MTHKKAQNESRHTDSTIENSSVKGDKARLLVALGLAGGMASGLSQPALAEQPTANSDAIPSTDRVCDYGSVNGLSTSARAKAIAMDLTLRESSNVTMVEAPKGGMLEYDPAKGVCKYSSDTGNLMGRIYDPKLGGYLPLNLDPNAITYGKTLSWGMNVVVAIMGYKILSPVGGPSSGSGSGGSGFGNGGINSGG